MSIRTPTYVNAGDRTLNFEEFGCGGAAPGEVIPAAVPPERIAFLVAAGAIVEQPGHPVAGRPARATANEE